MIMDWIRALLLLGGVFPAASGMTSSFEVEKFEDLTQKTHDSLSHEALVQSVIEDTGDEAQSLNQTLTRLQDNPLKAQLMLRQHNHLAFKSICQDIPEDQNKLLSIKLSGTLSEDSKLCADYAETLENYYIALRQTDLAFEESLKKSYDRFMQNHPDLQKKLNTIFDMDQKSKKAEKIAIQYRKDHYGRCRLSFQRTQESRDSMLLIQDLERNLKRLRNAIETRSVEGPDLEKTALFVQTLVSQFPSRQQQLRKSFAEPQILAPQTALLEESKEHSPIPSSKSTQQSEVSYASVQDLEIKMTSFLDEIRKDKKLNSTDLETNLMLMLKAKKNETHLLTLIDVVFQNGGYDWQDRGVDTFMGVMFFEQPDARPLLSTLIETFIHQKTSDKVRVYDCKNNNFILLNLKHKKLIDENLELLKKLFRQKVQEVLIENPLQTLLQGIQAFKNDPEKMSMWIRSGFIDIGCYAARANKMATALFSIQQGALVSRDELLALGNWEKIIGKLSQICHTSIGLDGGEDMANWIANYLADHNISAIRNVSYGEGYLKSAYVIPTLQDLGLYDDGD